MGDECRIFRLRQRRAARYFYCPLCVWDFELGKIFCGDTRPGYRAFCHPDNFKPSTNILLHQKADGKFEDVSEKAKITQTKSKALGVAFADFDDDGWTDIFVANDNFEQQLFRNNGDGTFEDVALTAGIAYDERGKRFAGMGIDIADYDLRRQTGRDYHRAVERNLSALPQRRRDGFRLRYAIERRGADHDFGRGLGNKMD